MMKTPRPAAKHRGVILPTLIALTFSAFAAPAALAAVHEHAPQAKPSTLPVGVNAVQNEMRLLTDAMVVIMNAVANNQLKAIPPAIQTVHKARQLTEQALESGTYKLAKGDLEAFIREDEAFHDELVVLMGAVKKNDLKVATRQVGVLMNNCTSCHTQYRF